MTKYKRVPIDSVPVGSVLGSPINDPNHPRVRLLAASTAISAEFIEKLKSRGIRELVVSGRDVARIHAFEPQGRARKVPPSHTYVQSARVSEDSNSVDRLVVEGQDLSIGEIAEPLSSTIQRPVNCRYEEGLKQRWASQNDEQVEMLAQFYDDSCGGNESTAALLREQCEDILIRLREDQDALVCLAASPFRSEYPCRHSIHLASMAMAVGVELALDQAHLIDLGIGCLIHDVGMQRVGLTPFEAKSSMTPSGLRKLADHPVHAVEIAAQFGDQISSRSKMVAYQLHERLDGSGYPRGRTADQIHALAKIAAVADAFVGMLAPRPHRLGIQGYYAIKAILREMREGKFDPTVVRALLQATSLHPIGSLVTLTNHQLARVIRSGGSEFDKPTIQMWPAGNLESEGAIVNMKEDTSIRIMGAIAVQRAA